MSEARVDQIDARLERLEEDARDIRATLRDLVPLIHRIDERLNGIDERFHGVEREMAHLATKAELAAGIGELRAALAAKPNRGHAWAVLAALTGAYTVALAAAALLLTFLPRWFPPPHG